MKTTAAGTAVSLLFSVIFGLLPNSAQAVPEGDEGCDPVTPKPNCPGPQQVVEFTQSCPVGRCAAINTPPIAQLECHSDTGIVWCEAWSQANGAKYQYYWTSSGHIAAPVSLSPDTPLASADCTGNRGWITVTVVNVHTNAASSATVVAYCQGNQ